MNYNYWMAAGQAALALLLVCILAQSAMALPFDATRLVTQSAIKYRVPIPFALAVSWAETRTQCGVSNKYSKAVGPMQIIPSTAKYLGHKNIGTASCAEQTDAGMAHLAICLEHAGGNTRAAARCHNGGISKLWSKGRAVNAYADNVMEKTNGANRED